MATAESQNEERIHVRTYTREAFCVYSSCTAFYLLYTYGRTVVGTSECVHYVTLC